MKLTNQINPDRLKVQSDSVNQVLSEGRGYRGSSKLEYMRPRQHLNGFKVTLARLGNTQRLLELAYEARAIMSNGTKLRMPLTDEAFGLRPHSINPSFEEPPTGSRPPCYVECRMSCVIK